MTASPEAAVPEGRRGRRAGVALLLIGAASLLALPLRGTLAAPDRIPEKGVGGTELDRIRWETRVLRMEVELATRGGPYFILDLPRRVLTLKLQGVVLREFPLLDSSARTSLLAGWRGGHALPLDSIWGGGTLLPAVRRKLDVIYSDSVTPPGPSGTVAFIPPSPEEAIPGPPSFRIRFPGHLSVVVAGARTGAPGEHAGVAPTSFPFRLIHWIRLKPWQRDVCRLDITMAEAEAGALYRAFEQGTPMMVAGPAPGPGNDEAGKRGKT